MFGSRNCLELHVESAFRILAADTRRFWSKPAAAVVVQSASGPAEDRKSEKSCYNRGGSVGAAAEQILGESVDLDFSQKDFQHSSVYN